MSIIQSRTLLLVKTSSMDCFPGLNYLKETTSAFIMKDKDKLFSRNSQYTIISRKWVTYCLQENDSYDLIVVDKRHQGRFCITGAHVPENDISTYIKEDVVIGTINNRFVKIYNEDRALPLNCQKITDKNDRVEYTMRQNSFMSIRPGLIEIMFDEDDPVEYKTLLIALAINLTITEHQAFFKMNYSLIDNQIWQYVCDMAKDNLPGWLSGNDVASAIKNRLKHLSAESFTDGVKHYFLRCMGKQLDKGAIVCIFNIKNQVELFIKFNNTAINEYTFIAKDTSGFVLFEGQIKEKDTTVEYNSLHHGSCKYYDDHKVAKWTLPDDNLPFKVAFTCQIANTQDITQGARCIDSTGKPLVSYYRYRKDNNINFEILDDYKSLMPLIFTQVLRQSIIVYYAHGKVAKICGVSKGSGVSETAQTAPLRTIYIGVMVKWPPMCISLVGYNKKRNVIYYQLTAMSTRIVQFTFEVTPERNFSKFTRAVVKDCMGMTRVTIVNDVDSYALYSSEGKLIGVKENNICRNRYGTRLLRFDINSSTPANSSIDVTYFHNGSCIPLGSIKVYQSKLVFFEVTQGFDMQFNYHVYINMFIMSELLYAHCYFYKICQQRIPHINYKYYNDYADSHFVFDP